MSDCDEGCTAGNLIEPLRNNYFYGKLLDERNLSQEQGYLNQKRWMLNRLGLGMGVLCGLTVSWTEDRVCISAGVAIDGRGREIVVPEAIPVDPWQTTDDRGRAAERLKPDAEHEIYICLAYVECPTDFTQVLVTDCDSPNRTAPSMISEKYAVIVKAVTENSPRPLPQALDPDLCLALTGADPETMRKEVCGVLSKRSCAGGDPMPCVVLASRITLKDGKIQSVDVCSARPVVYSNPELFEMLLCRSGAGGGGTPGPVGPTGPEGPAGAVGPMGPAGVGLDDKLTKITRLSWTHEGILDWNVFLKEGLRVDFSDEVTKWPRLKRGWFLVSLELSYKSWRAPTDPSLLLMSVLLQVFSWPMGTTRIHRIQPGTVEVVSNPHEYFAHFIPHPDLAVFASVASLLSFCVSGLQVMARVVLNCDFLLDKDGKAVDGNHLGGTLDTGDRVSGGQFESWFTFDPMSMVVPTAGGQPGRTPRISVGSIDDAIPSVASLRKKLPQFAVLADFLKIGD